jgi:hypothetical protein
MGVRSGARGSGSLSKVLGYTRVKALIFDYTGNKDNALEAIERGNGRRSGNGMRRGKIVARVHGDRVRISFLTAASRSWFGPLYEATLRDLDDGKVRLQGRLRLTIFETLNHLLLLFGFTLWLIEGLCVGGYREFGIGIWPALGISVSALCVITFLPRLSWTTRGWKIEALTEHLISLGFRNQ